MCALDPIVVGNIILLVGYYDIIILYNQFASKAKSQFISILSVQQIKKSIINIIALLIVKLCIDRNLADII
jgi:hypothetical protein